MLISAKKNEVVIEFFLPVFFAVVYFCLEPLLGQMYAIRAYSIFYIPYKIIKITATVAIILLYLFKVITKKTELFSGLIMPIICVYICYLIPIIFNGFSNADVWVDTVVQLVAYYFFVAELCSNKEILKNTVTYISWIYFVAAAVNFMFCISPGLSEKLEVSGCETFITTIENQAGFPLVMGALFVLLDEYYNKSIITRIKSVLYFILYFISIYIMWTAAQVIGAMILAIYLIPPVRRLLEKVDLWIWIGLAFAIFVVLVWFWEPIKNFAPFKFLIEEVLKKDLTFSGRLNIWQGVASFISESPVLGHGLMENPQYLFYDTEYNHNWAHAHSIFLQTLYEGGIITLMAVLLTLIYASMKIRDCTNYKLTGIFKIIVLVFLMNLEMDQFFIYPWRSCMWCMIFGVCNFAVMVSSNNED